MIPVPQTRQLSSPAQRFAFHRRDVRQRSILFARWNQSLEIQPQLKPRLLRLPAIIPNASWIEILSLLLIGDEFIFTSRQTL
jgi:hypothetical protein